jgi:UDP-N-acetylglucosamine--N-acetylmuramyl-(pentapeptide) pyrophosphoryl-undecaprenol N-acetylglucosamine transferase
MRGPAVKPIVIAAGGTGGHFFPAEALASELAGRGHWVALMTDARAAAKLPPVFSAGEVFVLKGAGIAGRGVRRAAAAAVALAAGTLQARALLNRLQPAAIVGFGGYPTVAPVTATRLLRHPPPVILHEQNAVLGRANRAMASRADVLALSFAATARLPAGVATVVTGNPVRAGFDPAPHPPSDRISILVLGGSLGARVFSDAVPAALAALPDHQRSRLQVVQQCRAEDLDRVRAAYAGSGIAAELSAFFPDVAARLAAADLVIARAGASTVAELAAAGRPAILVPLPGAIDDHQTANARALCEAGGAWLIPQRDIATLTHRLASLFAIPTALTRAGAAAASIARPDAAARLADLVLQHVKVTS